MAKVKLSDLDQKFLDASGFKGNMEEVLALLKEGADIHVKDKYGNAVNHAVNYRHFDTAKLLIEQKVNINIMGDGYTPLMQLLLKRQETKEERDVRISFIDYLITKGADVNKKDSYGCTALFFAHELETAKLLIDRGADVNAQNKDGETAIFRRRDIDLLKLLYSNGADLNHRDKNNESLYDVVRHTHKKIADFLLSVTKNG